jgi:transcriptional regulator with XRE-family HTH domain
MTATIESASKKEIGEKLRAFREALKLSIEELAGDFAINPVLISEMEAGNVFPGFEYLYYCRVKYGLNGNWLINGKGSMFSSHILEIPLDNFKLRGIKIEEVQRMNEYPVIVQILLAKITELSVYLKKELVAPPLSKKKNGGKRVAMTVPKPAARRRQDRFTAKEQRDANPATPA